MGLFNKFKNKTKGESQEKNDNKAFSDSWSFFPCNVNDQSFSIRFDEAIETLDEKTKSRYPHTLELIISANEIDGRGFPIPDEYKRINSIEDNFCFGAFDMRIIGVMTGEGCVRFSFCCNGEVEADDIIKTLLGDNQKASEYEYKVFPNDNFSYYYNVLAPNLYERNWIMDLQVCTNMENRGEVFQTPRQIDFLCIFESEQYIHVVLEKLQQQGFTQANCEKTEEGEYSLHFVIDGIPVFDWINDITADILDILDGTDGYFDGWGSVIHEK